MRDVPINLEREKLLNALNYFSVDSVMYPRKTKIFKLLYFFDFLHYENTGRPVTGQRYFAWKYGPVPEALNEEWKSPLPDFREKFRIVTENFPESTGERLLPKPNVKFDPQYFSRYELELMEALAKKHFKDTATQMIDKTHFKYGPWDEMWEVRNRKREEIPYELVFLRRNSEKDQEMLDHAHEKAVARTRYIR